MRRTISAILCSASLLLGGGVTGVALAQAPAAKKMTDITFSLDFIVLGRHAPFYVAIDKGFFREEGINVNIIPAKGTAQGIQNVESGIAQIGFIDVASLVVARAQGATVKVVSVIYQKAPYCFFSLDPGSNVRSLKDFEGLTVGSHAGSYISNIAKAMMRKNGLDPNKLTVESIEPSARIAMLATRKVPAIDFFVITKPAMERAVKDARVVTFLFADHGLDLYSNGIGAKESFLKENPDVMKGFVQAALKGYQYSFKHPREAAEIIQKHAKALNNDITVDELKIVEDLAVTPDVRKSGIGSFTAARMKSSVDWMVENGGFAKEKAPKVEDIYATGFLPQNPILP
ncbi:MAG: ABC transporter substrate-binding protein [Proteobacteria bacterium]|nr:ABC transporter substrate-binding protein [Pseudomonadota bacterium]